MGSASKVTVGMPVYNEGQYIRSALNSLLCQSYSNFEIVVADNASTDDTALIVAEIADRDSRVTLIRSNENLGVAKNFQRCLDAASSDYFMFASGHDLWSQHVLRDAVQVLDQDESVSVAAPIAHYIDHSGQPVLNHGAAIVDTRHMHHVARFMCVCWGSMNPIYGLIRAQVLRKFGPVPAHVGSDLVMLMWLSAYGSIAPVMGSQWFRREFRAGETYQQRQTRYLSKSIGFSRTVFGKAMPLFSLLVGLFKVVVRSPIDRLSKLLFLIALVPMIPARYIVARNRRSP